MPEGWGCAAPPLYSKEGYGMMHGKKLEVRGAVNVGRVHHEKLDIPKLDKKPLQKPKSLSPY